MERETLMIPQGLRQSAEIFDGYGKAELFATIGVTVASTVIALVAYGLTQSVAGCILFVLIMGAGSIMAVTKDKNNISMVLQVKLLLRFMGSQKKYLYRSRSKNTWLT